MGGSKTIRSRFRGKSEHSLDTKGRLNFPSRFREVLTQYDSEELILTTWKKHLRVYPVSEWEVIEDTLLDRGKEEPGLRPHIRLVLSGVTECKPDKQGRILIPAALRTDIHMGKEVVLTGVRDMVEIWDKEAWQLELQATRESFDSFDKGLAKLGIF